MTEYNDMSGYTPDNDLMAQRLAKARAISEGGGNPYANDFRVSHTAVELFERYGGLDDAALRAEPVEVSVAGRLRFRRRMGKASFLKIHDWSIRPGCKPAGRTAAGEAVEPTDDFLQLYVRQDAVGESGYALCGELDLGDFVGASGVLMRTRTGELTVQVDALSLLTKSLRPPPDKWHGLSDTETRFRQRYVDFAMNPRSREVLRVRSEVIRRTREFFHERDYLEVETPVLQITPGGAAARPFRTHHNALDLELFMRIAPELYLKRLLVGGLGRVFELGRVFRNEGISRQHNPEFTMLEFYQAYATFEDMMSLTEELLSSIAKAVHGGTSLEYDGHTIDFTPPWPRLTVAEAVARHTGTEVSALGDRAELLRLAGRYEIEDPDSLSDAKLLMEVFDEAAQPKLLQPTFVTHYPLETSPLSRRSDSNPAVVDRFELFVCGNELANAFSELNDPVDQYARFEAQLEAKAAGDEEAHPMDRDYVRALEYGMPPAAGEGIGIDRLVMIMADVQSIREVIAFPLLRPEPAGGAAVD